MLTKTRNKWITWTALFSIVWSVFNFTALPETPAEAAPAPAVGSLLITEMMAAARTSDDYEYLELYNTTSQPINLTNYQIHYYTDATLAQPWTDTAAKKWTIKAMDGITGGTTNMTIAPHGVKIVWLVKQGKANNTLDKFIAEYQPYASFKTDTSKTPTADQFVYADLANGDGLDNTHHHFLAIVGPGGNASSDRISMVEYNVNLGNSKTATCAYRSAPYCDFNKTSNYAESVDYLLPAAGLDPTTRMMQQIIKPRGGANDLLEANRQIPTPGVLNAGQEPPIPADVLSPQAIRSGTEAALSWTEPTDLGGKPDYVSVNIYDQDANKVAGPIPKGTTSATVTNLVYSDYTFTIASISSAGVESVGVKQTANLPVTSGTAPASLMITEIMAAARTSDDYEYLELYNATSQPIDLTNYQVHYYTDASLAEPWTDPAAKKWTIKAMDGITGSVTNMTIAPHGVKIVWLVKQGRSNNTIDKFLNEYAAYASFKDDATITPTSDQFVYADLPSGDGLDNTHHIYVAIVGPGGNAATDRLSMIDYNAGLGNSKTATCAYRAAPYCDFNKTANYSESVEYMLPAAGLDATTRMMQRVAKARGGANDLLEANRQIPSPGVLSASLGQEPALPAEVLNPTVTVSGTQATVSWTEPTDLGGKADYVYVNIYDKNRVKVAGPIAKGTTTATITGPVNGLNDTFKLVTVSSAGVESLGVANAVRVLSYNMHHGVGEDGKLDLSRIADVIKQSDADIVALQEVDNHWSDRSKYADQAQQLAGLTHMNVVFAADLELPPESGQTAVRQYGLATLSKYPILASNHYELPLLTAGNEKRGLLETTIRVNNAEMNVYNTHTSLISEERLLQTQNIVEIAGAKPGPQIVMGDFNAGPDTAEMRPMASRYREAFAGAANVYTYPVTNPTIKSDYIFYSPDMEVMQSEVIVSKASDHLPPFAALRFKHDTTPSLLISEIMAAPKSSEAYEYVELYNTTSHPIDLTNYQIQYYTDPSLAQPWTDTAAKRWKIKAMNSQNIGDIGTPNMIVGPHAVKVVWLVKPLGTTVNTIAKFNTEFGVSLTSDQFAYADLASGEGLDNTHHHFAAVVAPAGDPAADRISMVEYNVNAGNTKTGTCAYRAAPYCDFNKTATSTESVNYFFPSTGLDPISKMMERRVPASINQTPTPGRLSTGQEPTLPADVLDPALVRSGTQATLNWTEPTDLGGKADYVFVNMYDQTGAKSAGPIAKGTTSAVVAGLMVGAEYTFTIATVSSLGIESTGVKVGDNLGSGITQESLNLRLPKVKVAAIGDSITRNTNVVPTYPQHLGALLGNDFEVRNYGVSGTTLLKQGDSSYWNTPEYQQSKTWNPDIVVIMLGSNDSKPQNWAYKSQFVADYVDMINQYKNLPSHPKVFVNLPPKVYGAGGFNITDTFVKNEVIPAIKEAAAQTGSSYIDVYSVTGGMQDHFPDNVHPDGTGTKVIAKAVFDTLSQSVTAYGDFNLVSQEGPVIPGLKQGVVPQGAAYVPAKNWMLVSYYRSDGKPSGITVIDLATGRFVKALQFYENSTTPYTGHAGGLTVSQNRLWIASGSKVYPVALQAVIDTEDGDKLILSEQQKVETNASFVTYADGVLWVGEFARSDYPTDASHHMTNRDQTENPAWVAGYKLIGDGIDPAKLSGPDGVAIPDYILSIPKEIQGMAVAGNKIVLSRSYGRNNDSTLLVYNWSLTEAQHTQTAKFGAAAVPIWYMDGGNKLKSLTMPPMSEGIFERNGSLYVLFESGAQEYADGKYPIDTMRLISMQSLLATDQQPPVDPGAKGAASLLITEIMAAPKAAGEPYEYVELYNTTNQPIDLTGYKLHYYTNPGLTQPWTDPSAKKWNIVAMDNITGGTTDMTIAPHSTKIVWLIKPSSSNVTVDQFNAEFDTFLKKDQFVYAKLGSGDGLDNAVQRFVAIVGPGGDPAQDRLSMAAYNVNAGTGSCAYRSAPYCDYNKTDTMQQSVIFFFPVDGLDATSKMMERRSGSVNQAPTPGKLSAGQEPPFSAEVLNPAAVRSGSQAAISWTEPADLGGKPDYLYVNIYNQDLVKVAGPVPKGTTTATVTGLVYENYTFILSTVGALGLESIGVKTYIGTPPTEEPEEKPEVPVPPLLITEIMAAPKAAGEPYEYVELYNTTNQPIDLTGYKLNYYTNPAIAQPWTGAMKQWSIMAMDDINGAPTNMMVQPYSTKVVWLIKTQFTGYKAEQFIAEYDPSLTKDQLVYAKLGTNEGLDNAAQRFVAIAAPAGNRLNMAAYNVGAGTGSCQYVPTTLPACDYARTENKLQQSVIFYYPEKGLDADSRLMERRNPDSLNQVPTPGKLAAGQVPTGFLAIPGDQTVDLKWDSLNLDLLGYKVYKDGQAVTSSVVTVTYGTYSYNVSGLRNGGSYEFRLTGVLKGANGEPAGEIPLMSPVYASPYVSLGYFLDGVPALMWMGRSATAKAVLKYDGKKDTDVTSLSSITSDNPEIVSVTNGNRLTAESRGLTTLRASYGTQVYSLNVMVDIADTRTRPQYDPALDSGPSYVPPVTAPDKTTLQSDAYSVSAVKNDAGQNVARLSVDSAKLRDALQGLSDNDRYVAISYKGNESAVEVILPSRALEAGKGGLNNRGIAIYKNGVSFHLPLAALGLQAKAAELGVALDKMNIRIMISSVPDQQQEKTRNAASQSDAVLLTDAFSFTVYAEAGGKMIEINDFGGYKVTRTLMLQGLAHTGTVTGTYVSPDGGLHFVPSTQREEADGNTYVTMTNTHNSMYAAVSSTKTYDDIEEHWSQGVVEQLAALQVLNGLAKQTFSPDASITRAEFAAVLVNALGLSGIAPDEESAFQDVRADQWYASSVQTAAEKGFVMGYDGSTFKPDALVTREEMASMIVRAIRIAGHGGELSEAALSFSDKDRISEWARISVAEAVQAGIIEGMTEDTFVPADNATRAQAAAMVKRMMRFVQYLQDE
ncbi:lamin tail domain-containing protein [Paenibacillus thalictri]|nr:lamin tail domain-containing protein [Paenibacillus thalictri]